MELTCEQIGLIFQIVGVLIVLLSQVWFGYRAWRNYGSLKRAFLWMVSGVRVMDEGAVREWSEDELKKTFPEWWTLAKYLRENLWVTALGLVVTLLGLFVELLCV